MAVLRIDGRRYDQPRDLQIVFEGLHRVDGSATFGFGNARAMASVSGPIEVRLANEQALHATFEVNVRTLSDPTGTESKFLASTIRSLLGPSLRLPNHPRTLIQLVIQSLTPLPSYRRHYSLVPLMINASTLALMSCGSVPMNGVVFAIAIGRLRAKHATPKPLLIVDPSIEELPLLDGGGAFAFLFSSALGASDSYSTCEVVWSDWKIDAPRNADEVVKARELARASAKRLWLDVKQLLGSKSMSLGGTRPLSGGDVSLWT